MTPQFDFWIFIQRNPKYWFEKMYSLHVYCSIIYNNQDMEATKMSIDKQIEKKDASSFLKMAPHVSAPFLRSLK